MPWKWIRVWRILSYCWDSPVALVLECLIGSKFWISAVNASMLIDCNFRYFASLRGSPTMVGWNLQVSNNRKVVQNQIRNRYRENIASYRTNHKTERITVTVGKKVHILMEIERLQNISWLSGIGWWGINTKIEVRHQCQIMRDCGYIGQNIL